jgi:hypothetical protein
MNGDCLPFVYTYIIAGFRGFVKRTLHAVIMILNRVTVSWLVSMRLAGLAPTLLTTLLKSRLVCVIHVPNHFQSL